jgi:hypothetical protein
VVARNACRKEGTILVERIRAQVEAHAFDIGGGQRIHRTCSLGFAFFPFLPDKPDFLAWEQVVDLADHCLYASKRGGRNAWVGLAPSGGAQPEELGEAVSLRIAELLAKGILDLNTSFPPDQKLDWDLK